MKKNIILIIILLIVTLYYIMTNGSFLKSTDNFIFLSSENHEVPIRLYDRGENEMVLIFDDHLNMGIYQVLIIIPHHKIIGIPEGGKSSYINLLPNIVYQNKKAKQYNILGTVFFEKSEIFDIEFVSDKEIKFSSSIEDLQAYGDTFVLKLYNN